MREDPEPWTEDRGSKFANASDTDVFAASVGVLAFFFAGFCIWRRKKNSRDQYAQEISAEGLGGGAEGFVEMVDAANIAKTRRPDDFDSGRLEREDYDIFPSTRETSIAGAAVTAVAATTATTSHITMKSIAALLGIPLLVGLAAGFSTAYAPRPPILNICSNSVDWSYVMNSFADGSIGSSFTTLFSIYNPNRYDASLLGTYGSIQHKGHEIASLYIHDITITSHAITDAEAVVSFKASTWETFGILMEYYKGTLTMAIHVEFGFKVQNLNTLRINWTSGEMNIQKSAGEYDDDVGVNDDNGENDDEAQDTQTLDRHLCKCSEW